MTEVLVADLVDVDVGRDVMRVVGAVLPPRPRVEVHDDLRGLVDLVERLLQVARDRLVVLLLEVAEVAPDHLHAQVVVLTRGDHWMSMHSASERAPTPVGSNDWIRSRTSSQTTGSAPEVGRELFDRRVLDVAVGIIVCRESSCRSRAGRGQGRHLELPCQVVVQARQVGSASPRATASPRHRRGTPAWPEPSE